MSIQDWAWIGVAAGAISLIWAFQSWRRNKTSKPKHIVVLMALSGLAFGLAGITLTTFNVWSWSLPWVLAYVVIMLALAGSLFWDVIKSEGGGHDGHHTITALLAGALTLMLALAVGHQAVSGLAGVNNDIQTTSTVTGLIHHHHGHHH